MKRLITDYAFDASAKTVTFASSDFDVRRLLSVFNLRRCEDIYICGIAGKGFTDVTGQVVTMAVDTTAMADTDELLIFYDDVEGPKVIRSTTLQRPAGAFTYATRALIANDVDAGDFVPIEFPNAVAGAGQTLGITALRLYKSTNPLGSATFRVYICNAPPIPTVGDGVQIEDIGGNYGKLALSNPEVIVDYIDVICELGGETVGAIGRGTPRYAPTLNVKPVTGTSAYAFIVPTGAYGGGDAEQFWIELDGLWF